MDKQAVIQMALTIIRATESITVAGEHNRVQLSSIYRMATQIMAECADDEPQCAETAKCASEAARSSAKCARTEG